MICLLAQPVKGRGWGTALTAALTQPDILTDRWANKGEASGSSLEKRLRSSPETGRKGTRPKRMPHSQLSRDIGTPSQGLLVSVSHRSHLAVLVPTCSRAYTSTSCRDGPCIPCLCLQGLRRAPRLCEDPLLFHRNPGSSV